ncbi:g1805 [Coccomyxa elongata]
MDPQRRWLAFSGVSGVSNTSGGSKIARDIFAGTCGGIAVTLVGHPFDTAKVRLQSQSSVNPVYSGALDVVKKTIKWEGPQGLYKGVSSPLAGQIVFRSVLFGAFGAAKRWLSTNPDGTTRALTTLDFYKAGAITGFVSAFVEGPIDFFKSQIQVQIIRAKGDPKYKPAFTSVSGCVRNVFRTNGMMGPFQGLTATIIRNTPANSIYLGSFEVLKQQFAKYYGCTPKELPGVLTVTAAGTGGLMYWLAIYPIDQIKSAMMTDSIVKSERKFPTMASAVRQLYAEGGVPRFFKGFTPCLLRAFPANGVMLLTVDKVTTMLS